MHRWPDQRMTVMSSIQHPIIAAVTSLWNYESLAPYKRSHYVYTSRLLSGKRCELVSFCWAGCVTMTYMYVALFNWFWTVTLTHGLSPSLRWWWSLYDPTAACMQSYIIRLNCSETYSIDIRSTQWFLITGDPYVIVAKLLNKSVEIDERRLGAKVQNTAWFRQS